MLAWLQNQYIEVNSPIPEADTLFGLGEHISTTGLALRRDGAPLTLWTRDCAGADPDQNTYGAWPMLVDVRPGLPFLHPCLGSIIVSLMLIQMKWNALLSLIQAEL